jgi:ubiquinone/menaquinone biosynthesis C-methylase UbiE
MDLKATEPAVAPNDWERVHYSKSVAPDLWWRAHFEDATDTVIDFFGGDGISLQDKRVADVGCGDGIIDLGIALRAKPERIVGFDILSTDTAELTRLASERAGITELPPNLFFATSEERSIPAEDDSFDYVISWSAFEHIGDPVAILREIRRILTHQGVLFIQLWPFHDSAHGSHLVDWFPDGFAQYQYGEEEIVRILRASGDQEMAAEMIEIYRTLNRITVDELHDALTEAGFDVVKLALDAEAVHLPAEVRRQPLSRVGISGIKLLAIPREQEVPPIEADSPDEPSEMFSHQRDAIPPAAGAAPGPPGPPAAHQRAVRALRRGLARLDDTLSRYDRPAGNDDAEA